MGQESWLVFGLVLFFVFFFSVELTNLTTDLAVKSIYGDCYSSSKQITADALTLLNNIRLISDIPAVTR